MSVENVKVMFANARRVTAPEGAEGGPADAADEPRQLPPDDLPHASKPSPRKPAVGAGGRSGKKAARADKRLVDRSCALDNRYALVYGTDVVWSLDRIIAMRVSALRLLEGNDAVKQWLVSDGRRIVLPEHVVFDPTRDAVDADYVNLFGGIAMKPQSGDVAPILALFKHVCGEDEDTIEFVLNWLALPLQCLGAKMRSAVVVHGPEGSGKNLAFEIVRDIYGEYALIVGQDQLEDKFNDYLSRKLFIIGDEVVTRHEMRHHKGRLKALISGAEIQINAKMLPLRRDANFVNLVFLSNETQPLELDSGDRRYCVLWTPPPKPPAFYRAVGTCIANGGREAFYHYLLQRDLTCFDEFTRPPVNDAKAQLIEVGLRPPERFLREWYQSLLSLPVRPCTAEQLFRAYRRWCTSTGVRWSGEQATFTNALRKAGGDVLEYKVVNVTDDRGRKAHRCWIPSAASHGETPLARWMADAIDAFEVDLQRFTETGSAAP